MGSVWLKKIVKIPYGVLARILWLFVPIKRKMWIFGADYGNSYREGSKYLFEYMLKNHPEYDCRFVTQSPEVCRDLRAKGMPCVMNISLAGVWATARAECIFTCQYSTDVLFGFKKRGRRFFYLVHGQPMKVAMLSLAEKKIHERVLPSGRIPRNSLCFKFRALLGRLFNNGFSIFDSEFISATSDFLREWQKKDFGADMESKVIGMPRNDALFQPWRMEGEKWTEAAKGKFVVSYMPTHRLYGKGKISPTPFADNAEAQRWMEENGVLLVVKNHPNMIKQFENGYRPYESECIKDITTAGIDPMTVVYHSDVLITDYSSVWMDYLLTRRPMVFYIYDDFVNDDVGVYYDIKEERVGHFCYSEQELFDLLKKIKANYDAMRPADDVVRKFHKYVDGNSCERYFKEITRQGQR